MTSAPISRRWVLVRRPTGPAIEGCFELQHRVAVGAEDHPPRAAEETAAGPS